MKQVKGKGPRRSPLLFVGEGPGKNEETRGEPFVGATGQFVRRIIRMAGMDDKDVRFNNAVPVRCPVPKDAKGRRELLEKWHTHLQGDLTTHTRAVIVACGGLALARLNCGSSITRATGSVIPTSISRGKLESYNTLVVPCLHPASAMKGKIQAEKLLCEKAISRAVRLATGMVRYKPKMPRVTMNPSPSKMSTLLGEAKYVVIDTEFNTTTRCTYMAGFTTDKTGPYDVHTITNLTPEIHEVLTTHLNREDLIKVAHYHPAEVQAFLWWGIDTSPVWFDTMQGFNTLYPDLPKGLSHVARFYLDDVQDWKDMDHQDPKYNAIDVSMTHRIYEHLRAELSEAGMWKLMEEEIQPVMPLLWGLEQRGMEVDLPALRTVRNKEHRLAKKLRRKIIAQVDTTFSVRSSTIEKSIADLIWEIKQVECDTQSLKQRGFEACEVHPAYTGLRKKKFAANLQCTCQQIYHILLSEERRDKIALLRDKITKGKTKLKRWADGFDPDNNDHVRWLLYDNRALGLSKQRKRSSGNLTADATAIARLLALKGTQAKPEVCELLKDIKRLQQYAKRRSTFYKVRGRVSRSFVHPPYRMATGTGRPAGGADEHIEDKGSSENKFNALNIPNECRRIYVPHQSPTVEG